MNHHWSAHDSSAGGNLTAGRPHPSANMRLASPVTAVHGEQTLIPPSRPQHKGQPPWGPEPAHGGVNNTRPAVWGNVPSWIPSVLSTQQDWHSPLGARCLVVREIKEPRTVSTAAPPVHGHGQYSGTYGNRGPLGTSGGDSLSEEIVRENVIDAFGWMVDETLDRALVGASSLARSNGQTTLKLENFENYFALHLGIRTNTTTSTNVQATTTPNLQATTTSTALAAPQNESETSFQSRRRHLLNVGVDSVAGTRVESSPSEELW
eukprot:Lankesteria_metandrocarpae@DN4827_c0_g1_i3.p1